MSSIDINSLTQQQMRTLLPSLDGITPTIAANLAQLAQERGTFRDVRDLQDRLLEAGLKRRYLGSVLTALRVGDGPEGTDSEESMERGLTDEELEQPFPFSGGAPSGAKGVQDTYFNPARPWSFKGASKRRVIDASLKLKHEVLTDKVPADSLSLYSRSSVTEDVVPYTVAGGLAIGFGDPVASTRDGDGVVPAWSASAGTTLGFPRNALTSAKLVAGTHNEIPNRRDTFDAIVDFLGLSVV